MHFERRGVIRIYQDIMRVLSNQISSSSSSSSSLHPLSSQSLSNTTLLMRSSCQVLPSSRIDLIIASFCQSDISLLGMKVRSKLFMLFGTIGFLTVGVSGVGNQNFLEVEFFVVKDPEPRTDDLLVFSLFPIEAFLAPVQTTPRFRLTTGSQQSGVPYFQTSFRNYWIISKLSWYLHFISLWTSSFIPIPICSNAPCNTLKFEMYSYQCLAFQLTLLMWTEPGRTQSRSWQQVEPVPSCQIVLRSNSKRLLTHLSVSFLELDSTCIQRFFITKRVKPVVIKQLKSHPVFLIPKTGSGYCFYIVRPIMQTKRLPIASFSLVVVRNKQNKFLSVLQCGNLGWWLPGGRVEPAEKLKDAAIRECKEESGIDVAIKGLLRIQSSSNKKVMRQRIIYYGEPLDESQLPKSVPDHESRGAAYLTLDEILERKEFWRGDQLYNWSKYLAQGKPIYDLGIIEE